MKKILLIEDDFDTQILYGECLRAEDFDVFCADDGSMALAEIQKAGIPDLIFMDLNFPGMSAEEFLNQVRSLEGGETVPFIILSGDAEIQAVANNLKVQGFLKKPFDIDHFIQTAQKWTSTTSATSR